MDGGKGSLRAQFRLHCTQTPAPANAHYAMPWILWPTKDHWVFRQTSKEAPKVIEDQGQELSQKTQVRSSLVPRPYILILLE